MKDKIKSNLITRRSFLKKTATNIAALTFGKAAFPSIAFPKSTLRIGYIPILDHLTLGVSHYRDNKAFKNVHIDPKLMKSWYSVVGALKAKVLDGAFLLSNFAMDMYNNGLAIKTILIGHRHGSGITVQKDSNIQKPSDFKGKTIAIPAKVSTHTALLDDYLRSGGLTLKDVNTLAIAPSHMIKSMNTGKIDAFIVAEPFCAKAELEGAGKILVMSKDILKNHICCIVVVREEILKENPDGVQEWVSSLKRNGSFIDEDKANNGAQEVSTIGSKYLRHSKKVILSAMQNPSDRIKYNDLNPRIADFRAIEDISLKAEIIKKVDLDDFIDDSFFKRS